MERGNPAGPSVASECSDNRMVNNNRLPLFRRNRLFALLLHDFAPEHEPFGVKPLNH